MLKIKQYKNTKLFSNLIKSRIYLGSSDKLRDPKITRYLIGIRNEFCVFQLRKTLLCLRKAALIISKMHISKKKILFVGFPESEKYLLIPLFLSNNHFYTYDRFWFNGTLTNGKHFNICINAFKGII
jgi:ribosomal protein S2